jgi:hypothetical protein
VGYQLPPLGEGAPAYCLNRQFANNVSLLLFVRHELKQALVAPSGAKKEAYHIKQVQERLSYLKKAAYASRKNKPGYEKLNAT